LHIPKVSLGARFFGEYAKTELNTKPTTTLENEEKINKNNREEE
tara:strand:- start:1256 stop:1387 length:132 start_codon:yes stop_codon:yes gene_type:complete